jgi:hypothetical protein
MGRAVPLWAGRGASRLGAALVGLALAANAGAQPARSPLWGTLDRGRYGVGFRELLVRDRSRPALPAAPGATSTGAPGRQMQVMLWYPTAGTSGTRLRFADYVYTLQHELDFSPLEDTRRAAAIDKFVELPAALGGDTIALRAAMPRLLAFPVTARRRAEPASGHFPLVLFPEWRAPASNSVLAEYLASHGYVVASTTLKGTFDADPEISTRGLETQAADLRFVIAAVDTIRTIDARRLAAIGVGIAASGALALQMRTPAVAALVSLEGGITTEGEIGLVGRSPYFDVASVRSPILAITAPHPSVDPARLDLYRYATRHLVHFPRMGEFWFLNYGMLERYVPRIIGTPPGDTEAGFEWGARYVRRFLDAYLRGDTSAMAWLGERPEQVGAPTGLFTVAAKRGLPPPPTVAQLKAMLTHGGVAELTALAERRIASDSQPIPADYLAELAAWLGGGRDPDGDTRHDLATLRVRLYPRSARAHFALGMSASRRGAAAQARTHLSESLRLLEADSDPQLDAAARARLRRQAEASLTQLGS